MFNKQTPVFSFKKGQKIQDGCETMCVKKRCWGGESAVKCGCHRNNPISDSCVLAETTVMLYNPDLTHPN